MISLNDFTNVPSGAQGMGVVAGEICEEAGEDGYLLNVKPGENKLSVKFRHGDSGAKYKEGCWDNIESAIQLCLGKLAGDRVVVSVYDIQYKDLGEAVNKFADDPANLDGYVPDVKYEEGETFKPAFTEIVNKGSDDGIADNELAIWWVQSADWGDCGEVVTMEHSLDSANGKLTTTFAAGDHNWSVQIRYKHPDVVKGQLYRLSANINSNTAYGISVNGQTVDLTVGDNPIEFVVTAGDYALEVSCANTANDDSVTLVFSDLKCTELFTDAAVLPALPNEDWQAIEGLAKYATVSEEDGKAVYTIHQTLTFEGKTDAEILSELTYINSTPVKGDNGLLYKTGITALTKEALEAALSKMTIDLDGDGFAEGGTWGAQGNPKFISVNVTLTKSGNVTTIAFDAKYDVTDTAKGAYSNHYGTGWRDNGGNVSEGICDFAPGVAFKSEAVTVGNKTVNYHIKCNRCDKKVVHINQLC